jgi:hypothetical protein
MDACPIVVFAWSARLPRSAWGRTPSRRLRPWIGRLILCHDSRHRHELSAGEVRRYLDHVARGEKDPLKCLGVAPSTLSILEYDVLGLSGQGEILGTAC